MQASHGIRFEGKTREEIYGWVEKVLVHHEYQQQGRKMRGLLRQYLEKMTGLSRTQVTRLIARHRQQGKVEVTVYRRHRFAPRYPAADVELLAHVDEEHQRLSGPATRHILEREYREYGKENSMGVLNCKMGMSANF